VEGRLAFMATTNKVFIQIADEVIELKGADKDAFIKQQEKDNADFESLKTKLQEQKALKISAYTKLGLTEEEINAIL